MIRKALMDDMDSILRIVRDVIIEMQVVDNDQWTEAYPVYEDFYRDITAEELFVDTDNEGFIKSFVCLNTTQPSEYAAVSWVLDQKALIIHRMAVNPQFRGQGLAHKLLIYAEKRASDLALNYIRSDTCSCNPGMNSLFIKLKYKPAGQICFSDSVNTFICYEKSLNLQESSIPIRL
jgi:GNAT superfamily N-acetyltransferase